MKVAVISFRTFRHGGVERYAFQLVNHLAEKVEVHLFTHEAADGINAQVHTIPAVGKKDIFSVNSFMAFLKTNLERQSFDIIHAMGPLYLTPDIVTAHICQKRLLTDTKTLFGDFSLLRQSYWAIRSRIASGFQKKSFRNAKIVIAVSSMLADEIHEEYGIHDIHVIYPGISKTFFDGYEPEKKGAMRKDLKIDLDTFVILFVGSQWERKGLKFLIKAMKHLDGGNLLMVVGNGDEEKYRALARNYGVEQNVVFQGFKQEIIKYYLAADVLVLPSLYEPFGYPVLEAMAMGLPVIASRNVGAAEIIMEGETGFIVESVDDALTLSSKIGDIRSQGQAAFAKASRAKAEQFLWDRKIQDILSLYEKVYGKLKVKSKK